MYQITPIVKNLIFINIIVFFAVTYLFPGWMDYFMAYYPGSNHFHPIQIVTHMFMHGNLVPHLFFNMFMLYMFGSIMEYYWGEKYFLFVYLVSGFGAIGFHYFVKFIYLHYLIGSVSPEMYQTAISEGYSVLHGGQNYINTLGKINQLLNVPAVGASGAVMGILAAFGTQFPRRKLMLLFPPIPVEARILIPLLLVAELFMGVGLNDGVAHFAHIGGAITGFILTRFRYKFDF